VRVGPQPDLTDDAGDDRPFYPKNAREARERILRSIKARRGQRKFRDALLSAYDGACAISGCRVLGVLEAAHIVPYEGRATNHVTNGLLLRADLHTLFDSGLISIDAKRQTVRLDPSLRESEYWAFHGRKLRLPRKVSQRPSAAALAHQQEARTIIAT
jgi:putative restriction endonuclease